MTDTKLLNEIIDKSGYKRKYLADCLGISRFTLAKKIDNVTEFKLSEVDKLCKILKIESLYDRQRIFFAQKVD